MTINRILSLLLFFAVLLSMLSGCTSEESLELRMDISGKVKNLDPQFATDTAGRTIIANSFEGLLTKDSDGRIAPGVASSYTISADGLVYTFTLRRDARWSDDEPVTAGDFVFALRRLFHTQVPSPYAEEFLAIRNAPRVLAGELPQSALGVREKDDYTLEITLAEPSLFLLDSLCSTAAMPCNEKFFTSTRARYGLGTDYLKFNGAYRVSRWDNAKYIAMEPNSYYHTQKELPFPKVYLYTNRATAPKTTLDLFNEGKSDVYLATAEELERISVKDISYMEIKNRVWQLVYNTAYPSLDNESIRRGLTMALDSSGYQQRIPDMYGIADTLIPLSARPAGLAKPQLIAFDSQAARLAITEGRQQAELEEMPPLTILIPDTVQLNAVAGYLQKQWRDSLRLIVNLEVLPKEAFDKRLAEKKFSMALLPLESSGQDCVELLSSYTKVSVRNYGSFADDDYDKVLESGIKAASVAQSMKYYQQAEQMLIDKAAAVPLFTQSSYYALSEGTTGVSLVGGLLEFKNAYRTK